MTANVTGSSATTNRKKGNTMVSPQKTYAARLEIDYPDRFEPSVGCVKSLARIVCNCRDWFGLSGARMVVGSRHAGDGAFGDAPT